MTEEKKRVPLAQQFENDPKKLATIDAIALNSEAIDDKKRDDIIPADAGIMQHILEDEEEI
jgi:hypothetical protein